MKKKYSEILKESLINFDSMSKTSSTVNDILNYKGNGLLTTHKKANNVVSVLERMYQQEDGNLPVVKEAEETEIAQGSGAATKLIKDTPKTNLSTVATQADGVALPSPQKKNELKDNIVDAKTDDKTLATESSEEDDCDENEETDDELSNDPDACKECVEENVIFEEGDVAEIEQEGLENEPDHEAVGDESRAMKIGDGGAPLNNDETLGDDEMDGMDEESEGLPEDTSVNEDMDDGSAADVSNADQANDDELSKDPDESDDKLEEEMQEETDETGGDEEVEDGMDDECADENETGPDENEENETDTDENEEDESENTNEGEAEGIGGQDSEDELSKLPEDDETEETQQDIPETTPKTEDQVLDVDKHAGIKESIVSRENTEETIVERLIREMNLNSDTSSEVDEIEIEESFED
jgi:hypothetical protein